MQKDQEEIYQQVLEAKKEAYNLLSVTSEEKNFALAKIAQALRENRMQIIEANQRDLKEQVGKSKAFLDRLSFGEERIFASIKGIEKIISLKDFIGNVKNLNIMPNGLQIGQKIVPLGVVGIIYEARPNVTCDAIALCLKTSNAVILKGGKEALNTNKAIVEIVKKALEQTKIPKNCVQLITNTDREGTKFLMGLYGLIDVLIPRGGSGLIKSVVENSKVPVIETGVGNCHIFVDEFADFEMAKDIVINAKTSRVSVCNAAEKLLVHRKIAQDFLPQIIERLQKEGVEIVGDSQVCTYGKNISLATQKDYFEEYLDLKICIKIVDDLKDAILHINTYSSHHSESIITKDYANAQEFLNAIDSAVVYVNASTRFSDGEEFGLGGEIGISTQKLHARGPMGLRALSTSKYIVYGNGQIR